MISRVVVEKAEGGHLEMLVSDQNGRDLWEQIAVIADIVGPNATWVARPEESRIDVKVLA